MEGLGGPSTLLGNLFCLVALVLEVSGLGGPLSNLGRDGIERYDLLHEQGRDSGGKKTDEDIVVHDPGVENIALED